MVTSSLCNTSFLEKRKCPKTQVSRYICDLLRKLVFLKQESHVCENDEISVSNTNEEISSLTESLITLSSSSEKEDDGDLAANNSPANNEELNITVTINDVAKLSFGIGIVDCNKKINVDEKVLKKEEVILKPINSEQTLVGLDKLFIKSRNNELFFKVAGKDFQNF